MKPYYGVCDCGKWCDAPKEFNQTKHFMRCECGKLMILLIYNPSESGYIYKDSNKITNIKLVNYNR